MTDCLLLLLRINPCHQLTSLHFLYIIHIFKITILYIFRQLYNSIFAFLYRGINIIALKKYHILPHRLPLYVHYIILDFNFYKLKNKSFLWLLTSSRVEPNFYLTWNIPLTANWHQIGSSFYVILYDRVSSPWFHIEEWIPVMPLGVCDVHQTIQHSFKLQAVYNRSAEVD